MWTYKNNVLKSILPPQFWVLLQIILDTRTIAVQMLMSPNSSPAKSDREVPLSSRIDRVGVNPNNLIGKVLRRITRSSRHPTMSLYFADSTVFQILVEGYHPEPSLQGIAKELEMDSSLGSILSTTESRQSNMDLVISDCAFIRLTDKAFQKKQTEETWNQNHLGLAFKFAEDPTWHCVWATLVEYSDDVGECTFRSYDDVYIQPMNVGSPRKRRQRKRSMRENEWREAT